MKSEKEGYLTEFSNVYDHPAIVLWRAVEAKHISKVLSTIDFEKPILDLGSGDGKVSTTIFDQKIDVGIDISSAEIEGAKQTKLYNSTIVGDGRSLPFADESFGLVFSNCVIEHIPNVENVLRETSRVLKKGGYFIFTVPSENFANYLFFYVLLIKLRLKEMAQYYSIQRNKRLNHVNIFSGETWKKKLRDLNLKVVTIEEYLSKSTIEVWDLLVFLGFLWRKLRFNKLQALMKLPKFEKMKLGLYTKILKKYYYCDEQYGEGGGLLIVAQICDQTDYI